MRLEMEILCVAHNTMPYKYITTTLTNHKAKYGSRKSPYRNFKLITNTYNMHVTYILHNNNML